MDRSIRRSCIIIIFFSFVMFAGNNEELFLRANKLYEAGEYDNALLSYESISQKGRAVFYNMGNCYFHKNDYPLAFVYWMRAEKDATAQEYAMIQYNKNYVLQKIGKNKDDTWLDKIKQLFESINLYMSIFSLQILIFLLWGLFLFLYHYGSLKRIRIFLVTSFLFIFTTMLFLHYEKNSISYGIITEQQAHLFSGPDKGLDIIGFVKYADHVIIKEVREGWYKIRYSDNSGWVEAEAIQIV